MKLITFSCSNYKAFQENCSIEVRPLTLFFGKNNSGKSTLLRLPRLLLRALSSRARTGFPVKVDDLDFASNFRELTHGGLTHAAASFGITLEDQGECLELQATVQNVQNPFPIAGQPTEFSVLSHLKIIKPQQLDFEWLPQAKQIASYRDFGEVPFRGLLPETRGSYRKQWSFIEDWRERVQISEDQISYLGPVRSNVSRVFESGSLQQLGFDGAGAVSFLGQNRELLTRVSDWLMNNLDGWSLSLDYAGNAYHCLLQRDGVSVNLADVGHGIQQVLPVLVQQFSHQIDSNTRWLDLVEQPELHLHAAAHAPLGDLFLDTALKGNSQILVETHSENLLLRIRRRIAEGLDPNRLLILSPPQAALTR